MSLSALTLMSRLSGWGPPLMTRRPNDAGDCASVHAVGGVTPQAGVLAIAVVVENVTPDADASLRQVVVGVQVDLFVLDGPPESLDEHVGVHRQLHLFATLKRDRCG